MRIRSARWCAGILLLIGALTPAQAAGPLTQVGSWLPIGSPAYDLVIDGDLAYVATYHGLKIVDLSPEVSGGPPSPRPRGSINLGLRNYGIAFNACGTGYPGPATCVPHVYMTNLGRDLQIINVADPDRPVLVSTKLVPGGTWDIALKDDRATGGRLIAYVANFGGELYVIDVSVPATPVVIRTLGLNGFGNPAADAANLARLNAYARGGGGKVTGVSQVGDDVVVVEWAQGRIFHYTLDERLGIDLKNPLDPRFSGTSYAPFLFRVKLDPRPLPAGTTRWAYSLSAFGGTSGIYSVRLDILGPGFSLRHPCVDPASGSPRCGYFHTTGTDFGGLNISANGKYVFHISGKRPTLVQVLDVTNPTAMTDAGFVSIPPPYARLAQPMGLAQYGTNYIIAAGATLGLGVFNFQPPQGRPGLSD